MEYLVKRPHQGDVWYDEGDLRDAREADVEHLVQNDVLEKMSEKPANKMASVPENKNVSSLAQSSKAGREQKKRDARN